MLTQVAEGFGLETESGLTVSGGSNPSASAINNLIRLMILHIVII